jgi:hypothetical protein
MHKFLVRLIFVFVALWLPVQGVHAATMSLHVPEQTPSHETATPVGHCDHAKQQQGQKHPPKHSQPCGNSSNSHLCCSPALLPLALSVNEPIGSYPKIALSVDQFSSIDPEHPQRPPRPASV